MILVTGATGSVGRLVVDHLLERGATGIRALSARPDRAKLPPGVEVVEGFVGRPETLPAALDGVESMYLAPYLPTVNDVVGLAASAGVRHVVDLAGPAGNWWHPIEVAVEASGMDWTHLDVGEFMDNSLDLVEQIRSTGVVCTAYPTSANAPIDMNDIAAVAATTLLTDGHAGRVYTLTGPESLTLGERVAHLADALGRDVPLVEVTHAESVEHFRAYMGEFADTYVEGQAMLVDNPQPALSTVLDVTGRPGRTFAEWARRNVGSFR